MAKFTYEVLDGHSTRKEYRIVRYGSTSLWIVRRSVGFSLTCFINNACVFDTSALNKTAHDLLTKIKSIMPKAYRVSFYCCDSQEWFRSIYVLTYNKWDADKKCEEVQRYSDGTSFTEISIAEYFKSPPDLRY